MYPILPGTRGLYSVQLISARLPIQTSTAYKSNREYRAEGKTGKYRQALNLRERRYLRPRARMSRTCAGPCSIYTT